MKIFNRVLLFLFLSSIIYLGSCSFPEAKMKARIENFENDLNKDPRSDNIKDNFHPTECSAYSGMTTTTFSANFPTGETYNIFSVEVSNETVNALIASGTTYSSNTDIQFQMAEGSGGEWYIKSISIDGTLTPIQ